MKMLLKLIDFHTESVSIGGHYYGIGDIKQISKNQQENFAYLKDAFRNASLYPISKRSRGYGMYMI